MFAISRRRLVLGSAGLLAAGALAQNLLGRAALAAPDAAPTPGNFFAVSRALTGMPLPDPQLAQRLYQALLPRFPQLNPLLDALATLLQRHDVQDGAALQRQLAQHAAPLTQLYHALISGWYLGVIGDADHPECIAFENIVSYQLVHDSLMPPSYCPGEPNFWVRPPQKESNHV
ncbi:Membrane bound FAD containing D-sorbitol dehydrogenase [Serratia sp. FGI94]|uniref:sugar dehydrogenase complex small subunit n=1 Tax=Serratia sp. FGI94 TaxID=671990 RepID=UPI0002A71604|nr:sugar dehydrogenase complex small subunit [Serratia sp. FGI94]AGB82200.1 Membrane bound FAD containing D-sorbitol dehydrogenase [Serratia sp. FGI94]